VRYGAGRRRLFVFDFDGTLSPIVPVRTEARLHPACRTLLGELAAAPGLVPAVLSSRSLDDLVSRIPVPGLFLGGGSGLEWRLPRGQRIGPGRDVKRGVNAARALLAPTLSRIGDVAGADLEDKKWSIAVHYRGAAPEARAVLEPLLEAVAQTRGVRVFRGPAVAEIQLAPGWEKARGLVRLCSLLRFDPSGGRILYAGDDENDGTAMRFALSRKGTALAVGNRPRVPGARVVYGPASLVRAIRSLAHVGGEEGGEG